MHAALRRHTADAHRRAEVALALLDPALTRSDLADRLAAIAAAVEPLEASIAAALPPGPAREFAARVKAPSLRADLALLEARTRLEPVPIPPFDPERAFGAWYVLEGATLGGRLVAAHLERHLGLRGGLGYSYFVPYRDATARRWREFLALLEAGVARERAGAAVAGALTAFAAFEAAATRDASAGTTPASAPAPYDDSGSRAKSR